jgi:hypothetical protein
MAVSENQQSKHATEVKAKRENVHKKVDELMDLIENPSTTDAQRKECEAALSEMNDKFNRVSKKGGGQAFQEAPADNPPEGQEAGRSEGTGLRGEGPSTSPRTSGPIAGQSGGPVGGASPAGASDKDKDKK